MGGGAVEAWRLGDGGPPHGHGIAGARQLQMLGSADDDASVLQDVAGLDEDGASVHVLHLPLLVLHANTQTYIR